MNKDYEIYFRLNSKNKHLVANIGEVLFIEHMTQSTPTQSILSCSCPHVEKGGEGVTVSYPPKYFFFPPQSTP